MYIFFCSWHIYSIPLLMSYLLLICVSFLWVCCFLFLSFSEHIYSNVAYRQYTYWIRMKLGRQIPRAIPSCLVLKIWRASQVKVETVRALNMSINSLAVLLDNISGAPLRPKAAKAEHHTYRNLNIYPCESILMVMTSRDRTTAIPAPYFM